MTFEYLLSGHRDQKGTGCLPWLPSCSFEAGLFREPEAGTGSLQVLVIATAVFLRAGVQLCADALLGMWDLNSRLPEYAAASYLGF